MGDDPTFTSPQIPRQRALVRRVRVVHSPAAEHIGETRILEGEPLVLGRQPDHGVFVLSDSELSRRHCVFEPHANGHTLRDLGSHNRTYVNGSQIESATLEGSDVIRVGRTVLLYESFSLEGNPRLVSENDQLRGTSLALSRVRGSIADVAPLVIPVLILGETGVGKECVAHAIHQQSGRSGAFVPVNCGALPKELIESELFGHVAGAFTGAVKSKGGLFLAAEKGTLFLDELGEMPAAVQVKLLRVLADGEIRPVGASTPQRVDVRVVAATNIDLQQAIKTGEFRADLFSRINGWTIQIPPLRDRRSDIFELACHFLARSRQGRESRFTSDAAEALVLYSWPGNVREVEQSMGAVSVLLRNRSEVDVGDLPAEIRAVIEHRMVDRPTEIPLAVRVDPKGTPNREELLLALEYFGGNVVRVASFFERDRTQIYRWARALEIDLDAFRS